MAVGNANKETQTMVLDKLDADTQKLIISKTLPPLMWSAVRISKWLRDDLGLVEGTSHVTVGKWLERKSAITCGAIYGSKEFKSKTAKVYGEILENYYDNLKRLSALLRQLIGDTKIDKLQKVKAASDLFSVIREGTMAAKDLLVGSGAGADKKHLDMEAELDRIEGEFPMVSIIPPKK